MEGLDASAAMGLLRSALPDRLDESVLEQFVAETHGNPAGVARAAPRLDTGTTGRRVRAPSRGYRSRARSKPASADDWSNFRPRHGTLSCSRQLNQPATPALLWRAAELLGVDDSAASAAEAQGLLELSPEGDVPPSPWCVPLPTAPRHRRSDVKLTARSRDATDAATDPRPARRGTARWRPRVPTKGSRPISSSPRGAPKPAEALRRRPRSWSARRS